MARFGVATYGVDRFGAASNPGYDTSPFTAVSYPGVNNSVSLTWGTVSGTYANFYLVRRRGSVPSTHTAGYSVLSGTPTTFVTSFIEGPNSASPGFVPEGEWFYAIFFVTAGGKEYLGGSSSVFVVGDRASTDYLSHLVPASSVTKVNEAAGAIDTSSLLYQLLKTWGWEFDGLRGRANQIDHLWDWQATPSRHLENMAYTLGSPFTPELGIDRVRAILRDYSLILQQKGTVAGAITFLDDILGTTVTYTAGTNIMLDFNDSSFEQSVGRWTASGGTVVRNIVDGSHPAAVSAPNLIAGMGILTLSSATLTALCGSTSDAIRTGIPVSGSTAYEFAGYFRGTATNVSCGIQWFDANGTSLGAVTYQTTPLTLTGAYQQTYYAVTSPAGARYAIPYIKATGASTNYVFADALWFGAHASGSAATFEDARLLHFVMSPTVTDVTKLARAKYLLPGYLHPAATFTLS